MDQSGEQYQFLLPLMADNAVRLTAYELASKVIARNIPSNWERPFHLMELHLEENVEDMVDKLLIIEDQYRKPVEQKHPQRQHHDKHLRNPCRVHNGGHEWDDCRQNPRNNREHEYRNRDTRDRDNRDNRDRRGTGNGNGNSNRSR